MQGESEGTLDVRATPLWRARLEMSHKLGHGWAKLFPNFDDNYRLTQAALSRGAFHRSQMPVITTDDLGRLKDMLKGQVPSFHVMFNPKHLTPLQSQVYLSKVTDYFQQRGVAQAQRDTHDNPLFVSADRHIVDGHHRWLGFMLLGVDVPAYEFGLDAPALFTMAVGLSDLERHPHNA